MSKHLFNDMSKLERRLLDLGARVENAVRKSIRALEARKSDCAKEVIEGDSAIDQAEVELEEECLKILALHQPVATDLRFVAACLKINSDLERIGDLAVSIAERAKSFDRILCFPLPKDLAPMTEATTGMLRKALDSFVKSDVELARRVLVEDNVVDDYNRDIIASMVKRMHKDPAHIDNALLFLSASKNLERIADHATNIAEDVIYMVEGDIVRHLGSDI
ncbi:MAG: phosphate transport system protein [Planctomycetota bacterium]|jgi:phosphate transport system protein